MLDKKDLGIEDKAIRPGVPAAPGACPKCHAKYPKGKTMPPICPVCGAERVKGEVKGDG